MIFSNWFKKRKRKISEAQRKRDAEEKLNYVCAMIKKMVDDEERIEVQSLRYYLMKQKQVKEKIQKIIEELSSMYSKEKIDNIDIDDEKVISLYDKYFFNNKLKKEGRNYEVKEVTGVLGRVIESIVPMSDEENQEIKNNFVKNYYIGTGHEDIKECFNMAIKNNGYAVAGGKKCTTLLELYLRTIEHEIIHLLCLYVGIRSSHGAGYKMLAYKYFGNIEFSCTQTQEDKSKMNNINTVSKEINNSKNRIGKMVQFEEEFTKHSGGIIDSYLTDVGVVLKVRDFDTNKMYEIPSCDLYHNNKTLNTYLEKGKNQSVGMYLYQPKKKTRKKEKDIS